MLFILQQVDTRVVYIFWLLRITLPWTWLYRYLFKALISAPWGRYLELHFLKHMLIVFLIFFRNSHTVFHRGYIYHFIFPPRVHRVPFFTSSPTSLFSGFVIVAILMNMKWQQQVNLNSIKNCKFIVFKIYFKYVFSIYKISINFPNI